MPGVDDRAAVLEVPGVASCHRRLVGASNAGDLDITDTDALPRRFQGCGDFRGLQGCLCIEGEDPPTEILGKALGVWMITIGGP